MEGKGLGRQTGLQGCIQSVSELGKRTGMHMSTVEQSTEN